jgi:hypothetical protein
MEYGPVYKGAGGPGLIPRMIRCEGAPGPSHLGTGEGESICLPRIHSGGWRVAHPSRVNEAGARSFRSLIAEGWVSIPLELQIGPLKRPCHLECFQADGKPPMRKSTVAGREASRFPGCGQAAGNSDSKNLSRNCRSRRSFERARPGTGAPGTGAPSGSGAGGGVGGGAGVPRRKGLRIGWALLKAA